MMNRRQIYNRLVNRKMALMQGFPVPHDIPDQHTRVANTYAVKHTEAEFQRQFEGDQLLDEIIRLFGNGHNIHGVKSLLNLTRSEVLHALERGYEK